ncbi:MAG TPA: ATP-binding protein [Acetobacteraceae bacterium]|jgi:two-component system osmolarity sensor histidine kinase EnvZ|nr:ATP-binding protein [Acetobacteraceae bacterium]
MRITWPLPERLLRRVLPRSLLGRSLLMILLPLLLLEAVTLQIFYGSHLSLISRRLTSAVAGDVALVARLYEQRTDRADRRAVLRFARENLELAMTFEPGATLLPRPLPNALGPTDNDLWGAMEQLVHRPFTMVWAADPKPVILRVQLPDGVLMIAVPHKRLYAETIYVFLAWVVGTSVLLFAIASLFMRNQVRAIRRLAAAAEAFGMGRDQGAIKPEGAIEVRRAASAFNRMQERIRRFLAQRTELLAGVSHDLRTPLTRLRLALAMLPPRPELAPDVGAMTADVEEMERLVEGYLAFARGEGAEQVRPVDLSRMLAEVAAGARRTGADVDLDTPGSLTLALRPDAVRRAITNLVDNAQRHARRISLSATQLTARSIQVTVDDDGPGIPPHQREEMFRPFQSGVAGGTGLGLAIARDIVRAHGGEILLEESPLGGLRARIRLPV